MVVLRHAACIASACAWLLAGCGGGESRSDTTQSPASKVAAGRTGEAAKVLNLFIWSDYLAPDTLADFEKQTGIKVRASYYDNNETLETRLLAGNSGFDIVVPSADYFEHQITAGAYLILDKTKLPNLKNMDPELMAKMAAHDPDNAHGVIYLWASDGIGYNEKLIRKLLPDAPLDSWRLVFDPAVASKLSKCGISVLDTPMDISRAALSYLGKDVNSQKPEDLAAVEAVLTKVRPYIRDFNSSNYIEGLANGDLCVSIGYSGDILQARDRAREAGKDVEIQYVIPREGSIIAFDLMAIPRDAPNPDSAYTFINFMMKPEVIAAVSNAKRFPNANSASLPLVDQAVRDDPGIYPPSELRQKLTLVATDPPERTRALTRMWQKIKTDR